MSRLHRTLVVAAVVSLALALAACGDDDAAVDDTADTDAASASGAAVDEATVDIVEFAFDPDGITVAAGGTVTFTNSDGFAHTAEADDGSFDTGNLEGDAVSDPITFDEAGEIPYFCGIHNYMTGTITVTG